MISISHKYKLIHIHIPKTGGSSVNKWLKSLAPDTQSLCQRPHEPISHLVNHYPNEILNYHVFCVVRNPWARAVSLYHYRKKTQEIPPPHWPRKSDIDTLSFRDTVLKSQNQNPVFADICPPSLAPEIAWLEPSCSAWISIDGEIAIDQMCRLENIQNDLAFISEKTGCDVPSIPHVNMSKHAHYSEYYDEETRAIVATRYAKDIDHFGYRFGD